MCLLYPEKLSRVVCAPLPSLASPADCHAELATHDEAQAAFKTCRRESSQASPNPCWKEVRACKNRLHSEYRATLASVGQLQSIVDGSAYLLYWVLAFVGVLGSVAKGWSSKRRNVLLRASVLVLSLSLLSWLCFGLLLELLFPGGMIAH
tara:strand:- start:109 stop:558 length:450 start_codon:yes stop_codon:yes gene_type:complete